MIFNAHGLSPWRIHFSHIDFHCFMKNSLLDDESSHRRAGETIQSAGGRTIVLSMHWYAIDILLMMIRALIRLSQLTMVNLTFSYVIIRMAIFLSSDTLALL